ncbi:MAG: aa3-type cytochrome c oxidase subunit IV [Proteobacteria bacterium]|nr:aa3-type cytochrome c oxidase subunit IV [Pseudomonadota bacterium]
MAEASQDEYRAHLETYEGFSKLVFFTVLWLVLLLASMALGLVAHLPVIGVLLGLGGSLALIVGAAVSP